MVKQLQTLFWILGILAALAGGGYAGYVLGGKKKKEEIEGKIGRTEDAMKKLVDEATANFAASFGMSIGQKGCAGIYPAMLATIIAPTVGIDVFSPTFVAGLVAVVVISSFGVAGVGGGATFASLIVLGTMGLPIEIVGLLASVEPLIDMGRTALNVSDSMVAGVTASNAVGALDRSVLRDPEARVSSDGHAGL